MGQGGVLMPSDCPGPGWTWTPSTELCSLCSPGTLQPVSEPRGSLISNALWARGGGVSGFTFHLLPPTHPLPHLVPSRV